MRRPTGLGSGGAERGSQAQSLHKALTILEAFLVSDEPLGLTELSREVGLSHSTVHRLLATLATHRFVDRTGDGRYRLGIRLFQLGARVEGPRALGRLALPFMTDLAEAQQMSAFLSIRQGTVSVCIERVDRGHVTLAPYLVGETLPLHVGAAPLLLLAAMSDDELDRYLATPLAKLTPVTVVDPAAVRQRVERIRRDGHAVAIDGDLAPGISAVGARITGDDGSTVAAISLSGLATEVAERRDGLLAATIETAAAVSRQLRGQPGRDRLSALPAG